MDYPELTIDIPKGIEVKKIYHISDIHIHLYKKHDEYEHVFKNLYTYLTNEIKFHQYEPYEAIVVVTGDILHSKTELSPECIQLADEFFHQLSDIIPTLVIAGNHDANLSNKNRLDSLSVILRDMDQSDSIPLHYLKDTGIYEMNNIVFGVTSVFDYYLLKAENIPTRDNQIKIALFHGRVNGAVTDMGAKLDGEIVQSEKLDEEVDVDPFMINEEELDKILEEDEIEEFENDAKDKITPKSFVGYDYVLLGDIHKHQYLNSEKTIAYAGSLIQQNHGEHQRNHGVLVWDLLNGCSHLKEIPNDYGYYTFKIRNNKAKPLNTCLPNAEIKYHLSNQGKSITKIRTKIIIDSDGNKRYKKIKNEFQHSENCPVPKNCRLRIEHANLTYAEQAQIVSLLKLNHNIIETQFKPLDIGELDEEAEEYESRLTFNVRDVKCQNDFIDKYFSSKTKEKDKITTDELDKLKELNQHLNNDLIVEHNEHMNWKLCRLEFDNLFSYDEGNVIDFTKCNGVVGIIAPNHTGKSAIIDIIMYCLFDKFSRKGNIKDMINIKATKFRAHLVFRIGNLLFHIEKKGQYNASKSRRVSELPVSVDFYKTDLNNENEISLKEQKPKETMNKILDYVGSYDDMILTSVSLQGNNTNFIDITDMPRKNEMEKLLKIDIFTDLKDKASKIVNEKKTVLKYLKTLNILDEVTQKVKETHEKKDANRKLKDLLSELESKVETLHKKVDKYQKNISKLEGQSNTELWQEITSKFNLGHIGFQISKTDLNKIGEYNEEINELYKIYDGQWKNITQINKLDWVTLQKEIKKLHGNLVNLIHKMDNAKTHIETEFEGDNENILLEIKNQIQSQNKKLSSLHGSLIPLDDISLEELEEKKIHLKEEINDMELNPTTDSESLEDKIKEVKQTVEEYHDLITETEEKRDELMENMKDSNEELIQEQKEKILRLIGDLEDMFDKEGNWNIEESSKPFEPLRIAVEEFGVDQSLEEIEQLNKKIKKCHKKVKKHEKIKSDIEAQYNTQLAKKHKSEAKLEKLNWKLEKIEEQFEAFHSNKNTNKKIQQKEIKLNKLQLELEKRTLWDMYQNYGMLAISLANSISKFLNKIKNQEGDYVRYRSLTKSLQETELELKKVKNDRDKTKEAYYQIRSEIKSSTNDIIELNKKKEEITTLDSEIKLYQNYLDAVKNIPYMLIQSVKPKLEEMINEMLSTLVDFTIYFDIKDNKHISIYLKRETEQHRREVLLSNASGFEKFIGGLFIRIALINISNLPKPNFLFIDEGWSCFDAHNINNVGLIFDYLRNKFDFILTISHLQELRQHLNEHIILKKEEGWSHVYY